MTKEQVINLGKKALEVDIHVLGIMGMTMIFLGFVILFRLLITKREDLVFHFLFSSAVIGFVGFILLMVGNYQESQQKEEQVNKWKKEVATPYVESLPVEKREVVFIKIEPELTAKTKGYYYYTRSKLVERTPLTVSFKENGLTTLTNWYETHMELTNEKKPYVTYQYVDSKLGKGFKAGFYNVKIYLPKDYKFTDIK